MHRWRNPTLSVHGIEGAYSEPGMKTVIPAVVRGKFSIRIVPSMMPDEVEEKVVRYVDKLWKSRGSPNDMKVVMLNSGKPWTEKPDHPHYMAARKATKHVYNIDPDMTREGGSIPVTLTFQNLTGKNVLLLPVGAGDDGAHSQNEKIDIRNYIEGVRLMYIFNKCSTLIHNFFLFTDQSSWRILVRSWKSLKCSENFSTRLIL